MDATLSPLSRTIQPYIPVPVKIASGTSAETAAAAGQSLAIQPSVPQTAPHGEDQTAVKQTTLSFRNVYALSDHQFTIFKDASGKYVTRYVSLRDGKVTYIPDPTLVKDMQIKNVSTVPANIAISV